MATKTAAEVAALDPAKQGMLDELGIRRLECLPMDDGKPSRNDRPNSRTPNLSSGTTAVVPNIPIRKIWATAIKRGDFDDDDAAQVSGMDSMADGQLARARRNQAAGKTAFAFANENYETNIRRDRNGFVPPRATVGNHGRRNTPGLKHVGDGPIDINGTLSGDSMRQPRPKPSAPMGMLGRGAHGPYTRLSARAQPAQPEPQPSQPTVTKPQGQILEDAQSIAQAQLRVSLPGGTSIILQLPASLGAKAFPKKEDNYSGEVYLISGSQPSEDMLVLAVHDPSMPDIEHLMSEYDTYMSVSSTGVMLKFNDPVDDFKFYGLDFENSVDMNSFVKALRGLVERTQQQSQGTSTAAKVKTSAEKVKSPINKPCKVAAVGEQKTDVQLQVKEERKNVIARDVPEVHAEKQEADMSILSQAAQPIQAVNNSVDQTHAPANISPEVIEQNLPKPVQADSAPEQHAQAPSSISPEVIEDIIDWAWDTAKYMQHSIPEEFGFDTIRTIIRATSAAIIGRSSPSFRQLNQADQQRVIEGYVRPHVERGFLRKLARGEPLADEFADTEVGKTSQQLSQIEDNLKPHEVAPSKLPAPVYKINDMLAMRMAAASIELALPKIPRRSTSPDTRQHNRELPRVSIEEQVKQAAVINSDWLKKSETVQVVRSPASGPSCVNASQNSSHAKLAANHGAPSPSSSKDDDLEDFFSPALRPKSGSPPTGLRGSIHNRGGFHLSGHKGFVNKSSYQKDLEGLVAKEADQGNAFDHKVDKATEAISRLSLK